MHYFKNFKHSFSLCYKDIQPLTAEMATSKQFSIKNIKLVTLYCIPTCNGEFKYELKTYYKITESLDDNLDFYQKPQQTHFMNKQLKTVAISIKTKCLFIMQNSVHVSIFKRFFEDIDNVRSISNKLKQRVRGTEETGENQLAY